MAPAPLRTYAARGVALRTALHTAMCMVLAALLVVTAPPASAAAPSGPSEPPPAASRAGSRAGEGRVRPGRLPERTPPQAEEAEVPEELLRPPPPAVRPSPTAERDPGRHREQAQDGQGGKDGPFPQGQVLPLGAGLVLVGLGLAFLALRLRRGAAVGRQPGRNR